jgi:centrin-3
MINSELHTRCFASYALELQLREVTDAQRRELKEAFQLFDADRTGALDLHELKVSSPILGPAP